MNSGSGYNQGAAHVDGQRVPIAEAKISLLDWGFLHDEVFITTTAGGIMPITQIDGQAIGAGVPGPVTLRLQKRYWEVHEDPRYTLEINYC